MADKKNKPVFSIKTGGVSASVWKNIAKKDGKEYEFATISLVRSYKDKDGEWQTSSNFNLNDLPKVALVVNQVYQRLMLKEELDLSDDTN